MTKQELIDLAAKSKAPVKKLPVGSSIDWKPSWLRPVFDDDLLPLNVRDDDV